MPQFKNQLFPRRCHRKPEAVFETYTIAQLDLLGGQLLDLQLSLKTLLERQGLRRRISRGQAITRAHEQLVKDLIATGASRSQAAQQLNISRTAVSLIAAGKYPYSATA